MMHPARNNPQASAHIGTLATQVDGSMLRQNSPNGALNMTNYVLPIAIASLGGVILLGAWLEYASNNRRDAKLLAACGAGGIQQEQASSLHATKHGYSSKFELTDT